MSSTTSRVLVTGATGLVGSRLVRLLLREGHEVHALVRPGGGRARIPGVASGIRVVEGRLEDARTWDELAAIRPDACVHAAWTTEPGRYLSSPGNVDLLHGSARLAIRLADAGCARFVGVGTCFEHDTTAGTLSESSPLRPAHLYSACKAALHEVLGRIGAASGMSVAWARLFWLYGPAEDERRLVPSVVRSLLAGRPVATTDGRQVRDYLHADDVAAALWAITESGVEGAVNVGSGIPVEVREVVLTIADLVGRPDLVRLGAIPRAADDPPYVCADNRRLVTQAGWQARHSLRSGLQDVIGWWRARPAAGDP